MTKKVLLKFFKNHDLTVLSTCNLKNKPQSAVMCLITGDDYCFYLFTEKNSRKFHNIENNKKVSLIIGGFRDDPSAQVTAIVRVLDGKQEDDVKNLIISLRPKWQDYFSKNTKFLKITPKLVHYSDFSKNIFKEFIF